MQVTRCDFGARGNVKQEDKIKAQTDTLRSELAHREESWESTHTHTQRYRNADKVFQPLKVDCVSCP